MLVKIPVRADTSNYAILCYLNDQMNRSTTMNGWVQFLIVILLWRGTSRLGDIRDHLVWIRERLTDTSE